jgi:hypothetical protein
MLHLIQISVIILYVCEIYYLHLRNNSTSQMLENKMLTKLFWTLTEDVAEEFPEFCNSELLGKWTPRA